MRAGNRGKRVDKGARSIVEPETIMEGWKARRMRGWAVYPNAGDGKLSTVKKTKKRLEGKNRVEVKKRKVGNFSPTS
jgi:hypothetical protein